MKIQKRLYLFLLLILPFLNTYTQAQNSLADSLVVYLKSFEGKKVSNNLNDETLKKITSKDTTFLNILRKNETHQDYYVRAVVFYLYRTIGTLNQDTLFRREMTNTILRCCRDSIRSGDYHSNNFALCHNTLSDYDKYFTKNDFDSTFKNHLIEIVQSKKTEIEENLVLLIGWLELKETIPYLKMLLENGKNKEYYELAIYLALARMGDKEFVTEAIEKIKAKYNFQNRAILEDRDKYLRYIKQPEVVKLYIDAVDSKETFSEYDPFAENQRTTRDIACLALGSLMNGNKDFYNYILDNYYDKKLYELEKADIMKYGGEKAFHAVKFIDCSKNTYKAAKKWLIQKNAANTFQFDRSKYY